MAMHYMANGGLGAIEGSLTRFADGTASSDYQRINPQGQPNNPMPHGHGHLPGIGPGMRSQGPSIAPDGTVVPFTSPDAHWTIY